MKCSDATDSAMCGRRSDMQLYQEALSCMELIASQLESDTDYSFVSQLYQQCSTAITELRSMHLNPHISASLENLLATLSFQKNVLDIRRNGTNKKSILEMRKIASEGTMKYNDYSTMGSNSTSLNHMEQSSVDKNANKDAPINEMLVPYTGQTGQLDDVVGLEEIKEVLNEAVIMPRKFPQLFKGGAKPWKRLLLYGPPGTGKTKLARALASELQCPFYCVTSASLFSSWVGESEKLIRDLFKHARQQKSQTFIFFDEIDCLCRKRTNTEDEHSRRVKSELLRQLEGASRDEDDDVFVLAATNCPWDLDSAFLRRFQRRLYVHLPHSDARKSIISAHFSPAPLNLSEDDWRTLLRLTKGHSGADLTHLATAAAFQPIRELQSARFWKFTMDNKITPCSSDTLGAMQYALSKLPADKVVARDPKLKDFISALKSSTPTVTQDALNNYQKFKGVTK